MGTEGQLVSMVTVKVTVAIRLPRLPFHSLSCSVYRCHANASSKEGGGMWRCRKRKLGGTLRGGGAVDFQMFVLCCVKCQKDKNCFE